jgi:hypothetical protein
MISPSTAAAAAGIATGAAPSMRTLAVPLSRFFAACLSTPGYPPATTRGATSRRTRAVAVRETGWGRPGLNQDPTHR